MKGKLPIILSALIALVTVFGLVAAVVPTVASAATATDQINAITMPTQGRGNLALNTSIVALAQAADGTLFAGVMDTSGLRWPVAQGSRLFAVFTSTNGYDWTEGFKVPWDDNISPATGDGPIVAIVPVPDYSSNNSIVYMATEKFVYVSANGGKTFTRLDAVPGVTYNDETTDITSLDVAANPSPATGYVIVVGTEGDDSGVFTYNEGGVPMWRDKMIGNDIYTTNSLDVYAVKLSPNKDGVILAVYGNGSSGVLTIRGTMGSWGVDSLDAAIPVDVSAAKIALPTDYDWMSNPVSYVKTASEVYKVTSIQSPGAPSVKPIADAVDMGTIYDIAVSGSGSSTQAVLATSAINGGIQTYSCSNVAGYSAAWVPCYKQPAGSSDAFLALGTLGTFVACQGQPGGEGSAAFYGGVSMLVQGANGNLAWNGVGLIDTEIATRDYFGTTWTGGPVSVEASPNNKVDNTIFMITYSDNARPVMVWRTANGGSTWDMVCLSDLGMGDGNISSNYSSVASVSDFATDYFMTVKTAPTFDNSVGADQTVYMLGTKNDAREWLFKSTDAGNTWKPIIAMPAWTTKGGSELSLTAWCVVNDSTVLLSDSYGYVYKTTDNGFSWTDGAATALAGTVTSLKYYNDPTLGLVVLAGVVNSGHAALAFISTDGAVSFSQVGTSLATMDDQYSLVMVDFDNNWNTNHMVYAAFGGYFSDWDYGYYSEYAAYTWAKYDQYDAGVWRSPVIVSDPTSSLWTKIVSTSDFASMLPVLANNDSNQDYDEATYYLYPTALEIGPENTIYVTVASYEYKTGLIVWGGFIRCLDGTAATTSWDFVSSSLPGYGGLWGASIVAGSNNLFTIGYRYDPVNTINDLRLLNYDDTLASTAGGMVPASGAKGVGTISGGMANVPLSWGNLSGTEYKWQVALDSTFDNIVKQGTATTSTATVTGLELGTTYYWRVQAIEPAVGPWSAAVSFTTASTASGAPTLTSPANGASITATPIFTWSAVTGATSYKIQVATDSGFTSIVKDTTATTNVYASDKLSNGVYYWRVQATVGSDTTAWSATGAFTLGASTTTSSTPAWVWVLIVLGVVLAIFVLVLILRTRRPV